MTQFTMVQGGGEGIHLVPDFADQAAAQTFATARGIGGAPVETPIFLAAPAQQSINLAGAKAIKESDLTIEGDRRSILIDEAFQSVLIGFGLQLSVNVLTALGTQWGAVAIAWDAARNDIEALPDLAAVAAYDVVTDPAWP